jgi:hypothetical protein
MTYAPKKLERLIQLLFGKPIQHLDLQTLPSETEGHIIDHYSYRILMLINAYLSHSDNSLDIRQAFDSIPFQKRGRIIH